jgi:hypothetical protein
MPSDKNTVSRSDWAAVVQAFEEFFNPLGEVDVTGDEARFEAEGTGLAIRSDGTSRSFMPLHSLDSVWDSVTFDRAASLVTLSSGETTYTYRVPPSLMR